MPLALGVVKLWKLRNGASASKSGAMKLGGAPGVAAVTIATGGDNIGVYTPLFASQTPWQMAETIVVFAALTLGWCFGAWLLVSHPALGRPVRCYGRIVLPVVLIGLGAWIIYRSGAIAISVLVSDRKFQTDP